MAKIIGIKVLDKAITEAFNIITDVQFKWTEDWGFWYDKEVVGYALREGTIEDIWFNEFVEERFGYKVENIFMITVLHELGHYMTGDDIDGFVEDFCITEKEKIAEAMEEAETFEDAKALEWRYFNLPDEICATAWAVNFAKDNEELLDTIWAKVEKALHVFYAKNITKEG